MNVHCNALSQCHWPAMWVAQISKPTHMYVSVSDWRYTMYIIHVTYSWPLTSMHCRLTVSSLWWPNFRWSKMPKRILECVILWPKFWERGWVESSRECWNTFFQFSFQSDLIGQKLWLGPMWMRHNNNEDGDLLGELADRILVLKFPPVCFSMKLPTFLQHLNSTTTRRRGWICQCGASGWSLD